MLIASNSIVDYGRDANATNALSQCARFLLTREEATRFIDDLEENVRTRRYAVARREGVSEQNCERIARAFVYPGFRLAVTR